MFQFVEYQYGFFSKYFDGEILGFSTKKYMHLQKVNNFNFYPFKFTYNSLLGVIKNWHFIVKALELRFIKKHTFDVIISPNPLATGIAALIIGKLINAKVIVEVNGNFESCFKFGAYGYAKPSFCDKIKDFSSHFIIQTVLKRADMVKLVYSHQLVPLKLSNAASIKTTSFPNFVATRFFIEKEKSDGKYILLMGFPWYLKGVDILIRAFNSIHPEFPDYSLKIVGWIPEGKEYFEKLSEGNPKIELCNAVFYDKVIELMVNCSLYVLASRTDSSPRVLREAMAAKKPIIAANIDGVPELIIDGYNGLLFESENQIDLANKIRKILNDKTLANTLAENGFNHVQKHLTEEHYITQYKAMIDGLFEIK